MIKNLINKNFEYFPDITPFARENMEPTSELISSDKENSIRILEAIFDQFLNNNITILSVFIVDITSDID